MKLNLLAARILYIGIFLFLCVDSVFADTGIGVLKPPPPSPPTVTVTYPTNGTVVTDQVITVTGTAVPYYSSITTLQPWVQNSLGKNYQDMGVQNPWSFQASLIGGYNTIGVHAMADNGTAADGSVQIYYKQLLPLPLTINGSGTVTPNLTTNLLEVSQNYQITAQPSPGFAFAGWTGTLQWDSHTLSFTMASNAVLQANFVPTPFAQAAGNYYGVAIISTASTSPKSSGFLNLTLTEEGAFTASARLGNGVYSFSGYFLTNGSFSTWLVPKKMAELLIDLHLNLTNHTLSGQLDDMGESGPYQVWAAKLVYNSKTNPAPEVGKYTLVIPGGDDSSTVPGGDGYAAVSVDGSGSVKIAGKLGDGTPFTEKTFVTDSGECPFIVSLYSGNGSISGWLAFTNGDDSDIVGTLDWRKWAGAKKGLYLSGFEIQSDVIGSKYDSKNLNFTSGFLMLTNGGLSDPITITGNPSIIPQGKSKNQKVAGASLKVAPATGVFTGTVTGIPVSGVILQKQNIGGGFFLGTNQSGLVYLGP